MNRRSVMMGAASAAAAVGISSRQSSRAASVPSLSADFSDPKANLLALLKIQASTDPKQVTTTYGTGRVYACITGIAPIPLFGTHSISTTRARLKADGGFVLRQHIMGFRTAFESETVIDSMKNPVTGKLVELPLTDYGTRDTEFAVGINNVARPWSIEGDTLALSDDAVRPEPGPSQPKIDVITRYARTTDLLDPAVKSAESWFNFSAVDPFRPWLQMNQPGFQLWHVSGRKVSNVGQMPAFIAKAARERFTEPFDLPEF